MEYIPGVSYVKIQHFLNCRPKENKKIDCNMSKEDLGQILKLARSDIERVCIRYAVHKSSGLSETQARKWFGFENMSRQCSRVQDALAEAQSIRVC